MAIFRFSPVTATGMALLFALSLFSMAGKFDRLTLFSQKSD
jgi:hypothetical protein